jgi:hypothetical protein
VNLSDVTKPAEGAGAGSTAGLNALLARLGGGALGGTKNSSASTAANSTNVSLNPTIVNNIGGGNPNIAPYVDGSITGSPSTSANGGQGADVPRFQSVPSYLSGSPASYAQPASDSTGMLMLLGLGALALYAFES